MPASRLLLLGFCVACNAGQALTSGPSDADAPANAPTPQAVAEACDRIDNNSNGVIDEGCPCTAGETLACSATVDGRPKRGICTGGVQTCIQTSVEFATWGPCEGGLNAAPEIPGDCVDEDCDGVAQGCPHPCVELEVCGNGEDDDCNGMTDCEDPACECASPNHPDDGMGAGTPGGGNDVPDDGGGDSGSPGNPPDDGDGDDSDWPDFGDLPDDILQPCTERCVPGASRYCDEPLFCYWGIQECGPDGSWGACIETSVPRACEDSLDPLGIFATDQYNPACCVAQGFCCQNFGYDLSIDLNASVGSCEGIVSEQTCGW